MQALRTLHVLVKPALLFIALSIAPIFVFAQQAAGPTSSEREAQIQDAHQALLDNPAYQFDRPVSEPEIEPERRRSSGNWMEAIADALSGLFDAIKWLLKYAGPILIGVAVLAIIFFVLREFSVFDVSKLFRRRAKSDELKAEKATYRPDADMAKTLLSDADTLAAAGCFAEAVHSLLFRSIEDIRSQRGDVEVFLTSREIGDLDDLDQEARNALQVIIRQVEDSYFGSKPVGEPEWKSARAAYETFAFGGRQT